MAIIRWDPFRDLASLRDRMNRMFEDAAAGRAEDRELASSTWAPAVDVYETEEEMVLAAEVPGLEDKDIEIKVEDNTLSIRGERKFEKETKEENYHRIERAYGTFSRTFTLPNTVDQERIRAEHENGVLRIHLPKRSETKPRKVKIVKPQAPAEKK